MEDDDGANAFDLPEETRDRCYMPREVARAMLRPERTLTARVAELEGKVADHDKRIAALDRDKSR